MNGEKRQGGNSYCHHNTRINNNTFLDISKLSGDEMKGGQYDKVY